MDITKESIGELSAVVNIKVTPLDYEPRVEQVLRDYQKKAVVPGFRPGKVPQGMIKKMFGKSVLAEELNKLLQDSLYDYIVTNKIDILGQPIPKNSNDFSPEESSEFVFSYELGLAPAFDINFGSLPKVSKYDIQIDESLVNQYVVDLTKKFGDYADAESSDKGDILYGELQQLDSNAEILENGLKNKTHISIDFITDETVRKQFIGLNVGSSLKFNPSKSINNLTEVSSMLATDKTNTQAIEADYIYTVEKISRVTPAPVNQELFDKAYGKDAISTEEELKEKIRGEMTNAYTNAVQNRLKYDIEKNIIENLKITLPDDFLKRFITLANTDKLSSEDVEKQYDSYAVSLKWNLITDKISRENEISFNDDELRNYALAKNKKAFENYGVFGSFDSYFEQMADKDLADPKKAEKLSNELLEDKVFAYLEQQLVAELKTVSLDEFKALNEK